MPLVGGADAAHRGPGQRREVHVVEDRVGRAWPGGGIDEPAEQAGAVRPRRVEGIGATAPAGPWYCESATARTACSAASIAPPTVPE